MREIALFLIFLPFISFFSCKPETGNNTDWSHYLGSPLRDHYSPLSEIDTSNVTKLKRAWEYHTLDSGEIQCNPIIVDGVLFGTTATCEVFALDAETGTERWKFSPSDEKSYLRSRGVSHWKEGKDSRILYTYDEWLYALDAKTGTPIASFGQAGRISLKSGLGQNIEDKYVNSRTPGTIFKDLIVMPIVVSERGKSASGFIQAFNVKTGALAWVFRTIPLPGEDGHETWPEEAYKHDLIGGANNWSGMSVDKVREIIYVPTGSAAFDFYGGNRHGENLFANTLLALDANTGEKIWHYQIVHHDLWDRDLPAPPNLLTIERNGEKIDVVAQITKTGYVYVFDRETGEPVYPIDEIPVPKSEIEGEAAWPTQPIPQRPRPFSRQTLTSKDLNSYSEDYDSLLAVFNSANNGPFIPLSEQPTILFPGCDGGAEWGGAAVDKEGVMYVNSNEMAWLFTLSRTEDSEKYVGRSPGEQVYKLNCSSCHLEDRSGNPDSGYPSLENLSSRMGREKVTNIISKGQGMMPGFPQIRGLEKQALISFLLDEEKVEGPIIDNELALEEKLPWKFDGYNKFLDSKGMPAIAPPWGQLTAIDLNTGEHQWQIPLGNFEGLSGENSAHTGTENYGGPVVTAGGLLFIAATRDNKFRAYKKRSGELLWETKLPASGFATPSTYSVNGKQFVVIACGGTKLGTNKGDSYVAYTLP
ncbi:outer membrane protein assembly factor BamB family protein [Membranihabitans maritimus]|uniref:outer membrane protein assembly factor BamB family protein n=1 Tax=Membranihabitans maritimus TaxID=2904244 RepID=UPI001F212029|nr:PQQ-binding-like beta-propeller repeat protein [Membranihabitans maritimus]